MTVTQFCRAWILHLFGCVLFPDSIGQILYFISIVDGTIATSVTIRQILISNSNKYGCINHFAGDNASWMYLPCLTDWDAAGGYSWGSGVLGFLHCQLCEACRCSSQHVSVGGCVYLLQIWMWCRIPVGQPAILAPRPWFEVADLRLRPTMAYLWDQVRVNFARPKRAYVEYANELDTLTASMVSYFY